MNTKYKRFKYEVIVPNLIRLRNIIRKNGNRDNSSMVGIPKSFFIMGSGRNGSTVLAKYLNNHSNIFLPPETYSLPFSIIRYHLKINTGWSRFIDDLIFEVKNNSDAWMLDDKDYQSIASALNAFPIEYRNILNAYRTLYYHYSKIYKENVKYVGDHSPINTRFYKTTVPELTQAKFIFLLRDPIDTIYSYSKIKNHRLSVPEKAAWNWNQSIKCFDLIKKKNLPVILIRYKDLVTDAETTLNSIIEFLNLPKGNLLQEQKTQKDIVGAKRHSHHINVYKPLTSGFIGKGCRNLSDETVENLKYIVKENAVRFGYT